LLVRFIPSVTFISPWVVKRKMSVEIFSTSVFVKDNSVCTSLPRLITLLLVNGVISTKSEGAETEPVRSKEFATSVTESAVEEIAFGISKDCAFTVIGPAIDQSLWSLIPTVVSPLRPITSPPKLLESDTPPVFSWKAENAELPTAGKKLAVPVVEIEVLIFPVPAFVIRLPITSTSAVDEVTRLFEHVLHDPRVTEPWSFPEKSWPRYTPPVDVLEDWPPSITMSPLELRTAVEVNATPAKPFWASPVRRTPPEPTAWIRRLSVPVSPSDPINPATVPEVLPEIEIAGDKLLLEVITDLLVPKTERVAPILNRVPNDAESPAISIWPSPESIFVVHRNAAPKVDAVEDVFLPNILRLPPPVVNLLVNALEVAPAPISTP